MTRRTITTSLLVVACLVVAGCSPSSPSSLFASTPGPAPTVYTGTVMDSINGSGTLTVSLVTVLGLTSGAWDMSFGGKADAHRNVSGQLNGTVYDATVYQDSGDNMFDEFKVTGSLTAGSLTGSYVSLYSPSQELPARSGTIALTKR
jgi:hypothetical protein